MILFFVITGIEVNLQNPQEVIVTLLENGMEAIFNVTLFQGILSYDLTITNVYKGE